MTERGSDCSFIMPPICSPEQKKHKQEAARKHAAKASARFRAQTERHETLCVREALNMTRSFVAGGGYGWVGGWGGVRWWGGLTKQEVRG